MSSSKKIEQLRRRTPELVLQNPNYFGNLAKAGFNKIKKAAVSKIVESTQFEELKCLSYDPLQQTLNAIIEIKKGTGYNGKVCTKGSKEYIRFYVDYLRDGNWIDEGLAVFNAHDLQFKEDLCYAVSLKIDPKKRSCCKQKAILPKVRAILSWNQVPPTNVPNWLPVWGNRIEANIQIAPRKDFFCYLTDQFVDLDVNVIDSQIAALGNNVTLPDTPTVSLPKLSVLELKSSYANQQVEENRFAFTEVLAIQQQPNFISNKLDFDLFANLNLNVGNILDFIYQPKFNTSYEEIKCVGLNQELSELQAGILIKRNAGYSGGLCTQGSREYVAFYMDFQDGAGWEYVGVSSVNVHDVDVPKGGLWYDVSLPIDLDSKRQKGCQAGKAKLRAILSWNVAPPANDPNYKAHWGDREECYVEIQPSKGLIPGKLTPVIETVGSMPVDSINPNGLATGENIGATFNAKNSPFAGKVLISGLIANAPDSSEASVSRLRYRLMAKSELESTWSPVKRRFNIYTTSIINGIPQAQTQVAQIPDADGWLDYYPDYKGSNIVTVAGKLLGVFIPAENAKYSLYLEIKNPIGSSTITTPEIIIQADVDRPEVEISIETGEGNCGSFNQGSTISGKVTMKDEHPSSLTLTVTPNNLTSPPIPFTIDGINTNTLAYPFSLNNFVDKDWQLDTSSLPPCGYNIRVRGVDRTILNSQRVGWINTDIKGFCILPPANIS